MISNPMEPDFRENLVVSRRTSRREKWAKLEKSGLQRL